MLTKENPLLEIIIRDHLKDLELKIMFILPEN